jgi:hypothetical protein
MPFDSPSCGPPLTFSQHQDSQPPVPPLPLPITPARADTELTAMRQVYRASFISNEFHPTNSVDTMPLVPNFQMGSIPPLTPPPSTPPPWTVHNPPTRLTISPPIVTSTILPTGIPRGSSASYPARTGRAAAPNIHVANPLGHIGMRANVRGGRGRANGRDHNGMGRPRTWSMNVGGAPGEGLKPVTWVADDGTVIQHGGSTAGKS